VLDAWLSALEQRHLADLTFSEAARALRALSSTYVERRERLTRKSALDTAGKRAAYALYYSPLHFITSAEIVRALELTARPLRHILDLGCGAGAAGAAWAAALSPRPQITGIDAHPWAVAEAAWTYRAFGLIADTRRGDAAQLSFPRRADAIVAGWMLNELSDAARAAVRDQMLRAGANGATVLVIEPIATRVSPWWPEWAQAFGDAGGRVDEWRFRMTLPDLLQRFDRAAGLHHDVLTARSLCLKAPGGAAD
jgi:SAM-dependent methyltransferase